MPPPIPKAAPHPPPLVLPHLSPSSLQDFEAPPRHITVQAPASQRVLLPGNACPAFLFTRWQNLRSPLRLSSTDSAVSNTLASRALKVGRCNCLQRVYINSSGVFIPTYPGNEMAYCFLNAGSRPAESGFISEKAPPATKI